ncbi:MAG: GNAT family N-acetyltransferase [Candidatus Omnitrophica bacterium]|nr:GNAT family N-acetyltransferase [Candidatus Omnitrophota bacterium]
MLRLQEKDIDSAAEVFVRSFQNDPFAVFLAGNEPQRGEIMFLFFKFMLRYAFFYGEAYATSPHFEGAAVWLPSRYAKMTPELINKAGGEVLCSKPESDFIERMRSLNELVDAKHEQHILIPHWYLAFIGIVPDFQGAGFAGKLIKPMLERFSADGLPCYLETNNARNVAFYEHYGFRLLEEYKAPQAGLTFYAMLRK